MRHDAEIPVVTMLSQATEKLETLLLPPCPSSAYKSGEKVFDILLSSSFLIILPKSVSCGNSSTGQLGAVDQITDSCARA